MVRSLLLLIVLSFFIVSCTNNIIPGQNSSNSVSLLQYATGITDEEKVSLALQRKKELRNIRKGDYMTLKNNPEKALVYYTSVLEELPDDIIMRRKIAHVYYLLRDWRNSYENYHKVPINELKDTEQKELLQSLFFDDLREDHLTELSKFTLINTDLEYYKMIDTCYS